MKAFMVERYGDADTVHAGQLPDPTAGAMTSSSGFTRQASTRST